MRLINSNPINAAGWQLLRVKRWYLTNDISCVSDLLMGLAILLGIQFYTSLPSATDPRAWTLTSALPANLVQIRHFGCINLLCGAGPGWFDSFGSILIIVLHMNHDSPHWSMLNHVWGRQKGISSASQVAFLPSSWNHGHRMDMEGSFARVISADCRIR